MNVIRKLHLSRRTLLKSSQYAVGLPLLDAMLPALAPKAWAQQASQKNFLYFYFPFGTKPLGDQSVPNEGATPWQSWTMEQNLSSLSNHFTSKRMAIMAGINHAGDAHAAASTLTADSVAADRTVKNESFDNYLSRVLPGAASRRYPLFTLGVRDRGNRGDLRRHYISWRGPNQFNNKQMSASVLYDQIFANMGQNNLNASARHEVIAKKGAVDAVLQDMRRLRSDVSAEDKQKLDAYFENLRSVERRLNDTLNNIPANRTFQYTKPTDTDPNTLFLVEEKSKAMIDLVMIGFASEQNQIASIALDNAGGGLGHFADYNKSYHDAGRNDGSMHGWTSQYSRQHIYNVHKMLARLFGQGIDRMVEYGLLENSAFLMSSECGFHHVGNDTTFLVSGGMFQNIGGTHRSYNAEAGRLYTSIARNWSLNLNGFGRGQGPMNW